MPDVGLSGVGAEIPPPAPTDSEMDAPPPEDGAPQPEGEPTHEASEPPPEARPPPIEMAAPPQAAVPVQVSPSEEEEGAADPAQQELQSVEPADPQSDQPEKLGDGPIEVIEDAAGTVAKAAVVAVGGELGEAGGEATDKLADGAKKGVDGALGAFFDEVHEHVDWAPVIGDDLGRGVDRLKEGAHELTDQADSALRGWVADHARDQAAEEKEQGLIGAGFGAALDEFAKVIDPPPTASDPPPSPAPQPEEPPPDPPLGAENNPALTGATLGPGTQGMEEQLLNADVGTFLVGTSDRNVDRLGTRIDAVRAAQTATGRTADVMVDLEGPNIQLGLVAPEQIDERTVYSRKLEPGSSLALDGRIDDPGTSERIGITNFPELAGDRGLRVGDLLYLGGTARATVRAVSPDRIDTQVVESGHVSGHETVRSTSYRLPTADLMPADYQFATAAIQEGADSIAFSVDDPRDIAELRRQLPHSKVVAKIDTAAGLDRLDAIAQAADGLLIEPADLTAARRVEMPRLTQEMQDNITRVARDYHKPVFVGDMLDSMRFGEQPTPTDVLNVGYAAQAGLRPMLSDATRLGKNPVVTAQTAHEIAEQSLAAGGSGADIGGKPQQRAEIVATLGPSREGLGSPAPPRLDHVEVGRLASAGAKTFFFDGSLFSHDRATAGKQLEAGIQSVLAAAGTTGQRLRSMVDVDGPRVRVGDVVGGSIQVNEGPLVLNTSMTMSDQGDARAVGVPTVEGSPSLADEVHVGDKLQLGDGPLVEVAHVGADEVYTRVLRGGTLNSREGVRLMGDREFVAPPFTDRENALLATAQLWNIDVAATPPGFQKVDSQMRPEPSDRDLRVVARVENHREVEQISDVVNEFDAVIIDRDKLMQDESVGAAGLLPAQQHVIDVANAAGKRVYLDDTLEQMALGFSQPTFAEAIDVAYGRQRGASGFILPIRTPVQEQTQWEAVDSTMAVRMLSDIANRVR